MRSFLLLCFLLSSQLGQIQKFLKEIEQLDKQANYLNHMIKVQKAEITKLEPLIELSKSATWQEED